MNSAHLDPAWVRRLQARLDLPPARPRLDWLLKLGDSSPRIVGSIESALAHALIQAGIAMHEVPTGWQLDLPDAGAVNPTLAVIAGRLRAAGLSSAWRDELLDVSDASGVLCGAIERAAVRPLGIASRAVHLVVGDGRGAVWVQQRALDKAVDPGLWDTTVGGLMAAGESVLETLARETWEEAGLQLDALSRVRHFGRFTVRRPLPEGYMVEHIEMFEADADAGQVPVNQDGEVAGFACLAAGDLRARLQADAFTLEAAMILVEWLRHRA